MTANTMTLDAIASEIGGYYAQINNHNEAIKPLREMVNGQKIVAYAALCAYRVNNKTTTAQVKKALEALGTLSSGVIKRLAEHSAHAISKVEGLKEAAKSDGREGVLRVFAEAEIKTESALISRCVTRDPLLPIINRMAAMDAETYQDVLERAAEARVKMQADISAKEAAAAAKKAKAKPETAHASA